MIACICDILAIFIEAFRNAADLMRCIANVFFYSMMGCMTAQVNYEVDYREGLKHGAYTPEVVAKV